MHGRAFLTAILFGSAIAGPRFVAQPAAAEPQTQATTDPARCADQAKAQVKRRTAFGFARGLAGNVALIGHSSGATLAGRATAAAIDGAASADAARTPRCTG